MRIDAASYSAGVLTLKTSDTAEAIRFAVGFRQGEYKIVKDAKKRSLNANSMYWAILPKLAKAIGVSNPCMHNLLLRRYGQLETYCGKVACVFIPDTDDGQRQADEDEIYHLKPTSQTKRGKDGVTYRTYMLLRGSSKYNTAEFSRLVDGLISECKEVGIDILSENERSMMEEWERREKK